MHAVAAHFPHNFSAKLMYRGADEQTTETTRVTRLNEVWPSTFFPI